MFCVVANCGKSIFVKKRQLCKSCYNKFIRVENNYKESEKLRARKKRSANPEKYKQQSRNNYSKHRLKYLVQKKKYSQSVDYKKCQRAVVAKRKANKLKATPIWCNMEQIEKFYKNCPDGYEVDHIIPLKGKNVCGLHIIENLQYLSKSDNSRKGNKFDGILENNSWRNSSCQ